MTEYYCIDCGAEFEQPRILETGDGRYVRCPECKSDKVRFRLPTTDPPGYKITVEIEKLEDE